MDPQQPGTGDPQSGTPAAPAQGTTGQGTPTFAMPEKFAGKSAEDIARSYVELESQHGKFTDLSKRVEQYGGLDNLSQWAQYGSQAYQAAIAAQQQAQQHQPSRAQEPQGPVQDPYADWDLLAPKEQAQRLAQLVAGAATQYINTYGGQIAQNYNKQMQDLQSGLNRQWEIFRKANAVWRKNPNVDIDTLLQQAASVASGDIDSLFNIAMGQITGPANVKSMIDAEVQRRLADEKLKQDNQQINVLTNAGRQGFSVDQAPATGEEATRAIMAKLLQSGEFSPGHF